MSCQNDIIDIRDFTSHLCEQPTQKGLHDINAWMTHSFQQNEPWSHLLLTEAFYFLPEALLRVSWTETLRDCLWRGGVATQNKTAAVDVLTTHKADPEAVGAQHYAVYSNFTLCTNVLKVPLCSYIHCEIPQLQLT